LGEFSRQLAFGPVTRMLPHLVVPLPPEHPEGRVDWVAGAAVMIRLDVLADLDFFDPDYFLYFEEVDLMHRAARAGWETAYVPSARIVHLEGAATNVKSHVAGRPRRPAYWYRSWRKYYTDTYGSAGVWIAAFSSYIGALGNVFLSLVPGRASSVPKCFFNDFWQMVWRPLIGLVEKPYG
jgi:GT2 family glycosyltransferase